MARGARRPACPGAAAAGMQSAPRPPFHGCASRGPPPVHANTAFHAQAHAPMLRRSLPKNGYSGVCSLSSMKHLPLPVLLLSGFHMQHSLDQCQCSSSVSHSLISTTMFVLQMWSPDLEQIVHKFHAPLRLYNFVPTMSSVAPITVEILQFRSEVMIREARGSAASRAHLPAPGKPQQQPVPPRSAPPSPPRGASGEGHAQGRPP